MILYPAIDILDGQAVRLVQGDYDQSTVYRDSPLEAARSWVEAVDEPNAVRVGATRGKEQRPGERLPALIASTITGRESTVTIHRSGDRAQPSTTGRYPIRRQPQ